MQKANNNILKTYENIFCFINCNLVSDVNPGL